MIILKLTNDKCSVVISVDNDFEFSACDRTKYDLVYDVQNHNDLMKALDIQINVFTKQHRILLIGSAYCSEEQSAVLEGEILTLLMNDVVIRLSVTDGRIISIKELGTSFCNFEIYMIPDGYVIYGELDILGLDKEFNIKWSFSGRDIFVSQHDKNAFELCEDRIKLYDWYDNYYELSFNGELIREISV